MAVWWYWIKWFRLKPLFLAFRRKRDSCGHLRAANSLQVKECPRSACGPHVTIWATILSRHLGSMGSLSAATTPRQNPHRFHILLFRKSYLRFFHSTKMIIGMNSKM